MTTAQERLDTVLSRLNAERNGSGWKARCPAHDDQRASLSIDEGDNGGIVVYCHAGCRTEDIVQRIGLTMGYLSPPSNGRQRQTVATYDYRDADDVLRYQSVRRSPKGFFQRRPDGNGGWINNMKGVKKILYRLPELNTADPSQPVLIPEGEKDVDNLRALGFMATCNVGGAGKWRKSYTPSLRGREVILLPDNDDSGRDHARDVARKLHGVTASIKIIELPDLPEKGDVSDWLDAGGTAEQLRDLIANTPVWEPDDDGDSAAANPNVDDDDELSLASSRGRTEISNGKRLVRRYGKNFRWVERQKSFRAWDGKRWATDDSLQVDAWAKDVHLGLWADLAETIERLRQRGIENKRLSEIVESINGFIKRSSTQRSIRATVELAKSEVGIAVAPDRFDRHPWLFNAANCTIDLQTGEQREHRRDDYLTHLSPVAFDPNATCPIWDSFLQRIMDGRDDLISFLQRAAGRCLSGDVSEHVLHFCYGTGANGKSTFLNTIEAALGDYGMKATPELLLTKSGESHPTERADLYGKRFAACVEPDAGKSMAESFVKELTGGDPVKARRMRENFWQFDPTHKIWLAANHKPRIRGTDEGIWRRIKLIPFTVCIPEHEQDKQLPARLQNELPGILNWMLRGFAEWRERGLDPPAIVSEATDEYRRSMDTLGRFIDECCDLGERLHEGASELYAEYKKWAGENCMSQKKFGSAMSERGFERAKISSIVYRGLQIKAIPDEIETI